MEDLPMRNTPKNEIIQEEMTQVNYNKLRLAQKSFCKSFLVKFDSIFV